MPRVEFEPTIPAFERAKRVHALDRAATVIGPVNITLFKSCHRALTWNENSDPSKQAYVHITPDYIYVYMVELASREIYLSKFRFM
jgi:hypothetical protein